MSRSILAVLGLAFLALFALRGEGQDRPAPKSKDSAKRGAPGLKAPATARSRGNVGRHDATPEGEGESRVQIHHGGRFVTGRREDLIPRIQDGMAWHVRL